MNVDSVIHIGTASLNVGHFQWTGSGTALDLIAASTNSLNGALLARRPDHYKNFTVVGVMTMALLMGLGGGVTRDVILAKIPDAFMNPAYWVVAIGFGILGTCGWPPASPSPSPTWCACSPSGTSGRSRSPGSPPASTSTPTAVLGSAASSRASRTRAARPGAARGAGDRSSVGRPDGRSRSRVEGSEGSDAHAGEAGNLAAGVAPPTGHLTRSSGSSGAGSEGPRPSRTGAGPAAGRRDASPPASCVTSVGRRGPALLGHVVPV
jgi:hypothetical protein